ncbi:MAG: septum formation initiator family protein [Bacteroidales bacterium]|nr:septum formation initiator family protein [Bacteroidales bacterium]
MSVKDWAIYSFSKKFAKYIIAFLIFGFIIIFWDENNLIYRWTLDRKIHQLKGDIEHYNTIIDESTQQLEQLQNDSDKLEKYARENYLMKQKEEDIFIVEEQKAK